MKIDYTHHAREQMAARGIGKGAVALCVKKFDVAMPDCGTTRLTRGNLVVIIERPMFPGQSPLVITAFKDNA